MYELIMVVAAHGEECGSISAILEPNHYPTVHTHALFDLHKNIRARCCRAVILDMDSLPVDNRCIRDVRKGNPDVAIIVLSSRTFHPELQEALSLHISACLAKPVNPDELLYWVRSIFHDQPNIESSVGVQKPINDLE